MIIHYFIHNWKYSNAPEGKNPFEKVIGLSKYGFGAGVGVGIYDCILMSQAYKFWEAVNCMSYWVIPFTAMCATFASVAYTSTKLRGKDDYGNYIAASLATGGVFYHWQRNGKLTHSFTVLLLLCSALKKHSDRNNWKSFSLDYKVPQKSAVFNVDWTFHKDPRGPRLWEK